MTTSNADIVNQALQVFGARTTVTASELTNETSNEAIQANIVFNDSRYRLLRMAPWNCALKFANLWYLTSLPGTPENSSAATTTWQPGQPPPPWSYEYLYPPDCLRACWMIPSQQTLASSGVPITNAVTGYAPTTWLGQPIKFKEAIDAYLHEALTFTVSDGGSGFQVGEVVTFGGAPSTAGEVPAGLVQLTVATLSGSAIATATLTDTGPQGKSGFFFAEPTYTLNQIDTTGFGEDATITVDTVALAQFGTRVLLANQQNPTLAYIQQIDDNDILDALFVEAWTNILGGHICLALTGDKQLANMCIARANEAIMEARKVDGNEGLTINDMTPDFIRTRGYAGPEVLAGSWGGFDWGPYWPLY